MIIEERGSVAEIHKSDSKHFYPEMNNFSHISALKREICLSKTVSLVLQEVVNFLRSSFFAGVTALGSEDEIADCSVGHSVRTERLPRKEERWRLWQERCCVGFLFSTPFIYH